MIIYLIGLSIFQFFFLSNKKKIITLSLNLLYLISALLTYLLNPGTIYKSGKESKKRFCKDCKILYPFHKSLSHCQECGICVIGIDHHCGVFGKCIARYNIFWFYFFIICTFLSTFSCIWTLIDIMARLPF